MENPVFKFLLLEAARDFLKSLPLQARNKIYYNIRKVQGGIKDNELFKKLENTEIWEFRTLYNGVAYRLFSFWDKDAETFVIATHGIIKKTQKTPSKEIAKAEEIRQKYFESKNK
ncbi:MAG: type II toxin-antitoxin system RelE/ParE family toxin [Muribaculaceae bacterium]|nr:type II toxin-antitoxin system RelE/ParE family toxin [Muribaculaceae bacterium]